MASRLRISPQAALLALALAGTFMLAGLMLRQTLITTLNQNAVEGLSRSVITRAEFSFDYAAIKLGELYAAGALACDQDSLMQLERAVYVSGSVKDIVVRRDGETCDATYQEMHRELLSYFFGGIRARNDRISIKAVEIGGTPAAALTWRFSKSLSATAIINTDSLVFDVLPGELRDTGTLSLRLSDNSKIGEYTGEFALGKVQTMLFEARSHRYPIVARIRIPEARLAALNAEFVPGRVVAWIMVSLLLGYLVARGLLPRPGPVNQIRQALARGEIVPYFQPAYELATRNIVGFEVLARWPQRDGSMVPPTAFIPTVEAGGLSLALLSSLIRDTAVHMRELLKLAPETTFAFNVSPDLIGDAAFPEKLAELLEDAKMDPRNVIVEITERQKVANEDAAAENIALFKQAGIRAAIDDVGTGHNGLASIQRLGASILKIDKLFIDAVDRDPRSAGMVELLVSVAHGYGMTTVAEGIENAEQLAILAKLGIDEAQGHFLCEPVDAAAAISEFSRHRALLLQAKTRRHGEATPAHGEAAILKSA